MKIKQPQKGQIVKSTQGHDKGEYYVVYDICEDRVKLVNGTNRKVKNPKVKNVLHIECLPQVVDFAKNGAYNNKVAHLIKELKVKSED